MFLTLLTVLFLTLNPLVFASPSNCSRNLTSLPTQDLVPTIEKALDRIAAISGRFPISFHQLAVATDTTQLNVNGNLALFPETTLKAEIVSLLNEQRIVFASTHAHRKGFSEIVAFEEKRIVMNPNKVRELVESKQETLLAIALLRAVIGQSTLNLKFFSHILIANHIVDTLALRLATLNSANLNALTFPAPLKKLQGSIYYPASGSDTEPTSYLAQRWPQFKTAVHVDLAFGTNNTGYRPPPKPTATEIEILRHEGDVTQRWFPQGTGADAVALACPGCCSDLTDNPQFMANLVDQVNQGGIVFNSGKWAYRPLLRAFPLETIGFELVETAAPSSYVFELIRKNETAQFHALEHIFETDIFLSEIERRILYNARFDLERSDESLASSEATTPHLERLKNIPQGLKRRLWARLRNMISNGMTHPTFGSLANKLRKVLEVDLAEQPLSLRLSQDNNQAQPNLVLP